MFVVQIVDTTYFAAFLLMDDDPTFIFWGFTPGTTDLDKVKQTRWCPPVMVVGVEFPTQLVDISMVKHPQTH